MKKMYGLLVTCFMVAPVWAVDFQWQSFGSAYYAQGLNSDAQPLGFSANTDPQFANFSLIGLNLKTQFTTDWSAYIQLVGSGTLPGYSQLSNFNSFFQFGFVKYQPVDMFHAKLGRIAVPLWIASENFRMAAQQPYRTKPASIYNLTSFSAIDGLSLAGKMDVDIGSLELMLFGGLPVNDAVYTLLYTTQNMYGARVHLEGDGWKVRVQASASQNYILWSQDPYNVADSSVVPPSQPYDPGTALADTYDVTAGWVFDKFGLVTWGEYGYFKNPHPQTIAPTPYASSFYNMLAGQYFRQYQGGYVLLGYRFDKWLPRYHFARASSWDSTYPGAVSTHVVGLNYEWNKFVVVKAEFELDLFPRSDQLFAGSVVSSIYTSGPTRATAVYAGVDFVY